MNVYGSSKILGIVCADEWHCNPNVVKYLIFYNIEEIMSELF